LFGLVLAYHFSLFISLYILISQVRLCVLITERRAAADLK